MYSYDALGNITQVAGPFARTILPKPVGSSTYNPANQLIAWGGQSLSYDANGNLAGAGLTAYTWSARNQLVAAGGDLTASYEYDAIGRRTARTVGSATRFRHDGLNVVQERGGEMTIADALVNPLGFDEVMTRTELNGTYAPIVDIVGSVLALVDSAGELTTQYAYGPFGESVEMGLSSTNRHRYTGRDADSDELYYYRARYYSPSLSRFISEDPVWWLGNTNFYSYVGDDPISRVDPSGTVAVNVTGPIYRTVSDWDALTMACGGKGGFKANGCTSPSISYTCKCFPDGCGGYRARVQISGSYTVTAIDNPRAVATAQEIFSEEAVHVNDLKSWLERTRKRGEALEGQVFRWMWQCQLGCDVFIAATWLDSQITYGTRDWPGRNPHAPVKRRW